MVLEKQSGKENDADWLSRFKGALGCDRRNVSNFDSGLASDVCRGLLWKARDGIILRSQYRARTHLLDIYTRTSFQPDKVIHATVTSTLT